MRLIDRWAGTPLCFLLSAFAALRARIRPAAPSVPAPDALAFIALAEIGALVVAQLAIAQARQRFPKARLLFVTFPGGQEILRLMGFADADIVLLDPRSPVSLLRTTLTALRRLRREGVDATVNFEVYARFSTLVAYLSGARWRAGYYRFHEEGHYLGRLVTHPVIYNPHVHAAQSYWMAVEALAAAPTGEPAPKVALPDLRSARLRAPEAPAEREAVQRKLREAFPALGPQHRLVILNANASDLVPLRRWPLANYVALAQALLEDPDVVIVLTGTAGEAAHTAEIVRRIPDPRVLDLAGATTLRELIALYRLVHVMVTNDSGPAHFASLTDLATVVLFGPETPRIFGPLGSRQEAVHLGLSCSPCVSVYNHKRSACRDNQCLKQIQVGTVLRRVRDLLRASELAESA